MDPRTNIRKGMTVMSYDGVQLGLKGTVGFAGFAAPPPQGGLGLGSPHEPPMVERRAAGPGWDPH
ncbi:MAG TPA: hypothetical protein VNA24_07885 [Hyalangium sp.]|jgi:hypothetical protein|nr:hypothetical protein [Hyalangium sp.]